MAQQILYSSWWEQEIEHNIRLASAGVLPEDFDYILKTIAITDRFDTIPQDEENDDLANTLYLRLPSGTYAILRSGIYAVKDSIQTGNTIVHGYIADEDEEEVSPLLYAINNCFRTTLTQEEQAQLRAIDFLPSTPFPRPQFKLSQAEIRKFFSQGRLRTLSWLLQAVMDSHGNQRIIILNDTYPSLKYWFYGIHTCLPKNLTKDLTYSTYAFSKPDNCILICTSPEHDVNFEEEIEEGHFVIDNIDDNGCTDIESALYATYVVNRFWEDASLIPELTEGIGELMTNYQLNASTAAGILKLIEFDFAWFNSAYDIHYFLGKISTIDKTVLEVVANKLWQAFLQPDFKFKINLDTLPLLAYIFRNTGEDVKWDIISYVDQHKEALGYHKFGTVEELYNDLSDRLSFITEFLPISLIESDCLRDYCQKRSPTAKELAIFLYNIVDNYKTFNTVDTDTLNENTLYLFERLLHTEETQYAYTVIVRALDLPYDFLRYVIVQGLLNSSNDIDASDSSQLMLSDGFIYGAARLLIEREPSLSLELIKNYAREGKYHDSTLMLYHELLRDFPEETSDFEETLKSKAVYENFVTDSIFFKFASLQDATMSELTDFFLEYYLTGKDRNHYFESKLLQHVNEALPVNGIETADHFLRLIAQKTEDYRKYTLSGMLCSFILHRNAIDLHDYYLSDYDIFSKSADILKSLSPSLSQAFRLVSLLVSVTFKKEIDDLSLLQSIVGFAPETLLKDPALDKPFLTLFFTKLLRFLLTGAYNQTPTVDLTRSILVFLHQSSFLCDVLNEVWSSLIGNDPALLYPWAIRLLIYAQTKKEDPLLTLVNGVLDTIEYKERREVYRSLLQYADGDTERDTVIQYLSDYYYNDLTLLQKCVAIDKKKLFKNQE